MTSAGNPSQPNALPLPRVQTVAAVSPIDQREGRRHAFEAYLDGHRRLTHERTEQPPVLFDTAWWLRGKSVYSFPG